VKKISIEKIDKNIRALIIILQHVICPGNKRKKIPGADKNAIKDKKESK
jgi:hypothetical protein